MLRKKVPSLSTVCAPKSLVAGGLGSIVYRREQIELKQKRTPNTLPSLKSLSVTRRFVFSVWSTEVWPWSPPAPAAYTNMSTDSWGVGWPLSMCEVLMDNCLCVFLFQSRRLSDCAAVLSVPSFIFTQFLVVCCLQCRWTKYVNCFSA